ncbi:hypothetical protein F2Q69_00052113 [Brassica cretica]|uniref:Uncharacterized protein n=1 Tax=Brassica cretica TaxID=69181 RepID=A0A8S9N2M6_BRACR|nr:hypothetical protein F2Q69_00052113 [Brassica cretica]
MQSKSDSVFDLFDDLRHAGLWGTIVGARFLHVPDWSYGNSSRGSRFTVLQDTNPKLSLVSPH